MTTPTDRRRARDATRRPGDPQERGGDAGDAGPSDDRVGADREWIRRKGFAGFRCEAWRLVDPHALVWAGTSMRCGEHLTALRGARSATSSSTCPGMSKSITASVFYPAWVWGRAATQRTAGSWRATPSGSCFATPARCARWSTASGTATDGPGWIPEDRTASTAADVLHHRGGCATAPRSAGASRATTRTPSALTTPSTPGSRGVERHRARRSAEWWTGTMPSTLPRPRDEWAIPHHAARPRARPHQGVQACGRDGALRLPMRFERAHPHRWAKDPRTTEGELLCPARVPEAEVVRLETTLGPTRAAAQLQQRPAPAGGGTFKGLWFKRWTELPGWHVVPVGRLHLQDHHRRQLRGAAGLVPARSELLPRGPTPRAAVIHRDRVGAGLDARRVPEGPQDPRRGQGQRQRRGRRSEARRAGPRARGARRRQGGARQRDPGLVAGGNVFVHARDRRRHPDGRRARRGWRPSSQSARRFPARCTTTRWIR